MATVNFSVGLLPVPSQRFRSRTWTVRCANDRKELFNRIAPVYDNLNDLLSFGQHRVWKRMSVSWSRAKEGDNVLDLCCGSGDLTFLLSERVGPRGKVFALDFSEEQLSIASSRQCSHFKACYKNIEWVAGDAHDLPYSDCFFDAITIGFGLRNVLDRHKVAEEVYRVLKPGSKVSLLDFYKITSPFTALFQEWMLDNVVVPVASRYDLANEYKYLKTSIQNFMTGEELERLALEKGFTSAKHFEIAGSLFGNLVATK